MSSLQIISEAANPTLASERRSNEECRAMAVAYCHHRSRLRRAMEQCEREGAPIPLALRDAVAAFIDDSFTAAAHTSLQRDATDTVVDARGTLNRSSDAYSPNRSSRGALNATTGSSRGVTDDDCSAYGTASAAGLGGAADSVAADFNRHTIAATNIPLARTTFTADYKRGLAAAHELKRAGDRRGEVRELQLVLENVRRDPVPDPETAGRVLCALGDAHRATGDDVAAEAVYFDWFLLMEKAHNESACVNALSHIGQIYHDRKDYDGARKWLLQAAERSKRRGER